MAEHTRTAFQTARDEQLQADYLQRLCDRLSAFIGEFRDDPNPQSARKLEQDLKAAFDEAGRAVLEHEFNRQEPDDKKEADPKVRYARETYRINKKTNAKVASSFGPFTLRSFYYLASEDGEPGLHPLHLRLGIVAGSATGVLAERVALWTVDHTQAEVRRWLLAEHGVAWSNDMLRRVVKEFRRAVAPFRAPAQEEMLLVSLGVAARSRGRRRPVLAVGRDGIMTPLRGTGYQEGSTATVSVY